MKLGAHYSIHGDFFKIELRPKIGSTSNQSIDSHMERDPGSTVTKEKALQMTSKTKKRDITQKHIYEQAVDHIARAICIYPSNIKNEKENSSGIPSKSPNDAIFRFCTTAKKKKGFKKVITRTDST